MNLFVIVVVKSSVVITQEILAEIRCSPTQSIVDIRLSRSYCTPIVVLVISDFTFAEFNTLKDVVYLTCQVVLNVVLVRATPVASIIGAHVKGDTAIRGNVWCYKVSQCFCPLVRV